MMRAYIRHPEKRARPLQGFTLVESLIAATLLAVLFLAVAQTSSRASDAFDEGSTEHALSTSAHRGLERLATAIEFSDGSILAGLLVPMGAAAVDFNVPASFEGGAVQWMDVQIITELEPGELGDGLDNDGDGLVDERQVVHIQDAGQRRSVLVRGVAELFEGELPNALDDNGNGLADEAGLTFSALGNVITIRLTCQSRDEDGRLLTKTAETAVRLLNTGG